MKLLSALGALILIAAPAFADGMVLKRGNGAEPDSLDPQKYGLVVEMNIENDMFEGLVGYDAAGKPTPGMAERWDVSADGRVYTFHLRENLKWSDGAALTTDDIIAGMRRAFDPKTEAPLVDLGFSVKNARAIAEGKMPPDQLGVRAPDAGTIEITLESPSPIFILRIAGFPLFAPLPLHVYGQAGDGWAKPGTMVSNGPFVLESWTPSESVKLKKNPQYRDAQNVALDEVIYYPTPDENAALKQFRNGEIDLNQGFPIAQYEWLKQNLPDAVKLHPASTLAYMILNMRDARFQDVRVRRAISLAIDRETLTAKILATGQTPAYDFVPTIAEGWQPPEGTDFSSRPLAERQDEARRLLAEAGYGPDHPLTMRFDHRAGDANKRAVVAMAAMLGAVGIKADLQANELKNHINKLRQGDFELAEAGWQGTPEPEFFDHLLHTGSESNYGQWSNAAYDRLVDAARIEMDPAKRLALYQQADLLAMNEVGMIPLYYGTHRDLVQPWVKGMVPNPLRQYPSRFLRIER